jgi:hypothetical protein
MLAGGVKGEEGIRLGPLALLNEFKNGCFARPLKSPQIGYTLCGLYLTGRATTGEGKGPNSNKDNEANCVFLSFYRLCKYSI